MVGVGGVRSGAVGQNLQAAHIRPGCENFGEIRPAAGGDEACLFAAVLLRMYSMYAASLGFQIEITDIDPIKYSLIFERFLNPERVSMPDIDIDFCYERRPEVIDYVMKKYGKDRVVQIVTFGTLAAKGVIKDVGRALDIPYAITDRPQTYSPSTHPLLGIDSKHKELHRFAFTRIFRHALSSERSTRILRHLRYYITACIKIQVIFYELIYIRKIR